MNEIALRLAERLFDRPLIQNQYRSAFVEAMLEPHLGRGGWRHTGDDWGGWDFQYERGCKLEVKQSAARQTWHVSGEATAPPPKAAVGMFDIAERAGWYEGSRWRESRGRPAHIYVFAWHSGCDAAADHREPGQWAFFVAARSALPLQKTIRLSRVEALAGAQGSVRGPEGCAERVEALRGSIDLG